MKHFERGRFPDLRSLELGVIDSIQDALRVHNWNGLNDGYLDLVDRELERHKRKREQCNLTTAPDPVDCECALWSESWRIGDPWRREAERSDWVRGWQSRESHHASCRWSSHRRLYEKQPFAHWYFRKDGTGFRLQQTRPFRLYLEESIPPELDSTCLAPSEADPVYVEMKTRTFHLECRRVEIVVSPKAGMEECDELEALGYKYTRRHKEVRVRLFPSSTTTVAEQWPIFGKDFVFYVERESRA